MRQPEAMLLLKLRWIERGPHTGVDEEPAGIHACYSLTPRRPVTVSRLNVGKDRCSIQPPFSSLKPLLNFITPALGLARILAIRFIGERRLVCCGLHVAASTRT